MTWKSVNVRCHSVICANFKINWVACFTIKWWISRNGKRVFCLSFVCSLINPNAKPILSDKVDWTIFNFDLFWFCVRLHWRNETFNIICFFIFFNGLPYNLQLACDLLLKNSTRKSQKYVSSRSLHELTSHHIFFVQMLFLFIVWFHPMNCIFQPLSQKSWNSLSFWFQFE